MSIATINDFNLMLKSDYHDFYDSAFDSISNNKLNCYFGRFEKDDEPVEKRFERLESLGLETPVHGTVLEVSEKLKKQLEHGLGHFIFNEDVVKDKLINNLFEVVIYTDRYVHKGIGKDRIALSEALEKCPDCYCSQFLYTSPLSTSLRYLQIGKRRWWLEYHSFNDWRSNVGDGEISILKELSPKYTVKDMFFAIDFIPVSNGLVAIDYNKSPGLRLTGLENTLTGKDAVESLKMSVIDLDLLKNLIC